MLTALHSGSIDIRLPIHRGDGFVVRGKKTVHAAPFSYGYFRIERMAFRKSSKATLSGVVRRPPMDASAENVNTSSAGRSTHTENKNTARSQ